MSQADDTPADLNTPDARQRSLIAEFQAITDWKARYKELIERGNSLPPLSEEEKTDRYRVKGCQSQVWLHTDMRDGRLFLRGESDSKIVQGLVSLVLHVYSGAKPAEILATPPTFIDELGLAKHLSQTRANGLMAMVRQIHLYAMAFEKLKSAGNG